MKKYRIKPGSIADNIGEIFVTITFLIAFIFLFATGCEPEEPVAEVLPEVEVVMDNYTYDVPLDPALQLYINNTCEEYGIDPALVIAQIGVESNYNADCIGDGGDSIGLCQIQPKWWSERMTELGATDLLNPYHNVTIGIDIIARYISEGQGIEWALMSYNGGVAYSNKLTAEGRTSDYAIKVMAEAYRLTTEREGLDVLQ